MKKTVSIALATLLVTVIGCATVAPPKPMRGADVTAADTAPDLKAYSAKTPGVGEPRLITRTFVGQPPLVPHNIEKYVPLTATARRSRCASSTSSATVRSPRFRASRKTTLAQG